MLDVGLSVILHVLLVFSLTMSLFCAGKYLCASEFYAGKESFLSLQGIYFLPEEITFPAGKYIQFPCKFPQMGLNSLEIHYFTPKIGQNRGISW